MGNYTVYKHTSPSGKVYIGITSQSAEKRWGYNGYGYNGQPFFSAVLKYGWDNIKHEILFTNLTQEEAERKEIELIKLYNSNKSEYGYNADNGGFSVGRCGEQTKKKISEANKGRIAWNKGIPRTDEEKRKMSLGHIGKTKGKKNGNYGKPMSEEAKRKSSEAHKGKIPWNKGKHISESQKTILRGRNSMSVICVETGIVFASILDASHNIGVSSSAICNCLKGKTKRAGGYHWRYCADNI